MKKNVRKQGILLPISSIPSTYGIGTFGKESYRFVDFLEKSGNHLWQILPLGPTGYGDSPYQSFSTFAGNPYYIDLELLIEDGYLTKEICDSYDFGDNEHYVDYEKIYLLNSHPSFPFCKRVSHFESDLQILYPTFHFCNDFPVFFLAFMI